MHSTRHPERLRCLITPQHLNDVMDYLCHRSDVLPVLCKAGTLAPTAETRRVAVEKEPPLSTAGEMETRRKRRVKIKSRPKSEDESDDPPKAFVIPPPLEDDDLSKPPMTGEHYLRRVVDEAKLLKPTTIADITNIPLKKNPECPELSLPALKPCGKNLLFSKEWQLSATADFSELRLKMEELREKMPLSKREKLDNSAPNENAERKWKLFCIESGIPSTEFCLAISQERLTSLLRFFGKWMTNETVSIDDGCLWVFCLLACLQLPVDGDVYASIRQIARAIINSRSLLEIPEIEVLPQMNLLICIIGRYFRQADLADPFIEEKNCCES